MHSQIVISRPPFKDIREIMFLSLSFKINIIHHTNTETNLEIQVFELSPSKYPTFFFKLTRNELAEIAN